MGRVFISMASPQEAPRPLVVRGETPHVNGVGGNIHGEPRSLLVEAWRNAPVKIDPYFAGTHPFDDLSYPSGQRLIIGEEQVMDTCETPAAQLMIELAFDGVQRNGHPLQVMEAGYGLGITSRFILQKLIGSTGGASHYDIIELNNRVAQEAAKWAGGQTSIRRGTFTRMAGDLPETRPQIDIEVHEGDASEVTARFAAQGRQYDVIVSDTYPLSENERGLNDLIYLDNVKQILRPDGRFVFFAHFPGSNGGVVPAQRDLINEHFNSYRVEDARVNPPPSYEYLQQNGAPVRRISVVACWNPRI